MNNRYRNILFVLLVVGQFAIARYYQPCASMSTCCT